MNEFLFGTLSTTEQRVAYSKAKRQGVRHDHRLTPQAPRAGDRPTITVTLELPRPVERVLCAIQEPEQVTVPLQRVEVEWDLLNWSYEQVWQARLPAFPEGALVRYAVEATARGEEDPIAADGEQRFSYLVGEPGPPAWAKEAVVYQIVPDRFHPGRGRNWRSADSLSDVYGGTLRGIIERLDYVADLGFNCIWLTPFFPDDTYHHYHATDYFAVDPGLGTMDDVRELVDAAHEHDIRLLLDFVANHWGRQHPTFQAALQDRNSDYVDWYFWDEWPERYETFFGVQALPKVNVDHPGARNYLLRAADYWLRDVGFDGYRLDYAPGPSHDFWTHFRATVKAAQPEAWIFGEVVETPPVQLSYDGRLDGTLDFLLMQALRNTFALRTMSVAAFDGFLQAHEQFFPSHFSRPSFLDNHDVNRMLWLVDGDKRRLKLATLCQFTLAGPPIVYYGTEVGLSQRRDVVQDGHHILEEARAPMTWGDAQDVDLRRFYKGMIQFRRAHPALWNGERQTVHVDERSGTYAYVRRDGREEILVALNVGDEERQFAAVGESFDLAPWGGDVRIIGD